MPISYLMNFYQDTGGIIQLCKKNLRCSILFLKNIMNTFDKSAYLADYIRVTKDYCSFKTINKISQFFQIKNAIVFCIINSSTEKMISQQINQLPLRNAHMKKLGEDVLHTYSKYKNDGKIFTQKKIGNEIFDLPQEFQVIKYIGFGQNQIVVGALDHRNRSQPRLVAIKKMTNSFQHRTFAKRTLREIKILRLINHQNIIKILTIILPKSREQFKDIYLVFPMSQFDFLKLFRSERKISEEIFQFYLYQVLRAFKYIHSAGIIHRNLKPANIVFDENNQIKIKNFYQSKFINSQAGWNQMTEYMGSRWYKAPEVLIGKQQYTHAIDIWSIGCTFAQIWSRKPFFRANSTKQQLISIIETMNIESGDKGSLSYEAIESLSPRAKRSSNNTFQQTFKGMSSSGQDLMKKMLSFIPEQRPTIQSCLQHQYLSSFHLEEQQPKCENMDVKQFQFEDHNLTLQQYKDLIYEQILLYHFEDFVKEYENRKQNGDSLIDHILKNSNATLTDPLTDGRSNEDD